MTTSQKLITAGSDASAGMIVGGKTPAEKIVEAAMRGVVEAVSSLEAPQSAIEKPPQKIDDETIKRAIRAALTVARKMHITPTDGEIDEAVVESLKAVGAIRSDDELDPERVVKLLDDVRGTMTVPPQAPADLTDINTTPEIVDGDDTVSPPVEESPLPEVKADVGEVVEPEVNINVDGEVQTAEIEATDGTPVEQPVEVPEAETTPALVVIGMADNQTPTKAAIPVHQLDNLDEYFAAERERLFESQGQIGKLREGVTREQAQDFFKRKQIYDAARGIRYSNGRTAAETINQFIKDGFKLKQKVAGGRLRLADGKGNEVLLSRKEEADYYRMIMGEPVKAEMTAAGEPEETAAGEVIEDTGRIETPDGSTLPSPTVFAHEVTPSLSKQHGQKPPQAAYLPSEMVYSKSLRSLGQVVKSEYADGTYLYTIKLVTRDGITTGMGVVEQADLQPRSMRAIKRLNSTKSTDPVEQSLRSQIEGLCEQLKTLAEADTIRIASLDACRSACKQISQGTDFQEAYNRPALRRYVRAIQDIEHSLRAAVHILEDSELLAEDAVTKNDADLVISNAQEQVKNRCKSALERAEGCLMDEVPLKNLQRTAAKTDKVSPSRRMGGLRDTRRLTREARTYQKPLKGR